MTMRKRSGGARAAGGARGQRRRKYLRKRRRKVERPIEAPSNRRGRPTKFRPEMVEQARKLCQLGATDRELAEILGVEARTIYRWHAEHADFAAALKVGKDVADDRVERSMFLKAVGYSLPAVKMFVVNGVVRTQKYVEHYPPDTVAMIFWLKNRRGWRDRQELTGKDGEPLVPPPSVVPVVNLFIDGRRAGSGPAPEAG